jgi:hypothetical protein
MLKEECYAHRNPLGSGMKPNSSLWILETAKENRQNRLAAWLRTRYNRAKARGGGGTHLCNGSGRHRCSVRRQRTPPTRERRPAPHRLDPERADRDDPAQIRHSSLQAAMDLAGHRQIRPPRILDSAVSSTMAAASASCGLSCTGFQWCWGIEEVRERGRN